MRSAAMGVLVLAICLPPLLISLDKPGPQQHMEGLSLLTSQETWQRQRAGEATAWLTPTQNGSDRVRKPPLMVWLNMLAWSDLDPDGTPTHTIIRRARLVTVGLAIVMILSTGWIGCTLGDRRLGLLAALMVGTMFMVQQQARIAAYDMHLAAWATLSIAAALWTMRPLGEAPPRRIRLVGLLIAALALALAWLSKGPIAIGVVVIPLAAVILVDRHQRIRHVSGAAVGVAIAAVLVAPWFAHLQLRNPGALTTLAHEYGASLTNEQPFYYYAHRLLLLALPWTMWVIAGLAQPFVAPRDERNRTRWIAWLWFALLLAAFSLVPGKATRYILPIAPAMALLAAFVWRDLHRENPADWNARGARALLIVHWSLMLATSVGYSVFVAQQNWFVERGWLKEVVVEPISAVAAAALAVALLAVAALGAWSHWNCRPVLAAIAMAAWLSIASTVGWQAEARAFRWIDSVETDSARIASIVGSAPLGYLWFTDADVPDHDFLFFMRRIVPLVKEEQLREFSRDGGAAFVMAEQTDRHDQGMRDAGYESVAEFRDDHRHHRRLWRGLLSPPAPSGGSGSR